MKKLSKLLKWTDDHILQIMVIGFIFIIPLWPKLPIRMINYTYVAFRVDDVYVAIMALIYGIQFLRKKVTIPKKILILFLLYWGAVFASFIYGYYVSKTVNLLHLGFLHSARRIEYMIIFLVVFSTIKSKLDFYRYLKSILFVLFIVSVYGFGQKFIGWPAVQTMNPEFAKGYFLVLDSWARVSSTFAGHYDLAAYLVLLMPIVIGFYLHTGKKIYMGLFVVATGLLVLSASRASYGAFLICITAYLVYIRKFKILAFVLLTVAVMTPLSDNLSQRITRTFQQSKVFVDSETGEAIVARDIRPDDLPPGDYGAKGKLPSKKATVTDDEEKAAKAQIRDALLKEAQENGKQYTKEELESLVENVFGRQIPVVRYLPDISISTRLQVSWPRALEAFSKNLLLGTGPSSLGEATDGDYLRWLGETGILGTGLLLSIFFAISWPIFQTARRMTLENSYLFHSFVFAHFGVFINASYIDIFEASKFAYTFWLVAGIFYASYPLFFKQIKKNKLLFKE